MGSLMVGDENWKILQSVDGGELGNTAASSKGSNNNDGYS